MHTSKCIFISGSSRGLGLQLAEEYVKLGYLVIGCSRGNSSFKHDKYVHYEVDIVHDKDVMEVFSDIRKKKFNPQNLINNAGIELSSLLSMTKVDDAQAVINTNLMGTFLVSREMIKIMQRSGFGRIVNLSSICVSLGTVGASIYNASKAGLEAMGYSLANECKSFDITLNTLGLSYVEKTGMSDARSNAVISNSQQQLLKPSFLQVDEVVKAINFFAAPESKNITGQTIYFGGVR